MRYKQDKMISRVIRVGLFMKKLVEKLKIKHNKEHEHRNLMFIDLNQVETAEKLNEMEEAQKGK